MTTGRTIPRCERCGALHNLTIYKQRLLCIDCFPLECSYKALRYQLSRVTGTRVKILNLPIGARG